MKVITIAVLVADITPNQKSASEDYTSRRQYSSLRQGLADVSLQATSGSPPGFINTVFLEHSHALSGEFFHKTMAKPEILFCQLAEVCQRTPEGTKAR